MLVNMAPSLGFQSSSHDRPYISQTTKHNNSIGSNSSRRVWIRRPGLEPTTVHVFSSDLVDDLKSFVLMKYPNSLATFCDPADLSVRLTRPSSLLSDMDAASSGRHNQMASHPETSRNSPRKSPIPNPTEVVLQPDELVYNVLDQYFPGGMTMKDAFIVEQTRMSNQQYNIPNMGHGSDLTIKTDIGGGTHPPLPLHQHHQSTYSPLISTTPGFGIGFSTNSTTNSETPSTGSTTTTTSGGPAVAATTTSTSSTATLATNNNSFSSNSSAGTSKNISTGPPKSNSGSNSTTVTTSNAKHIGEQFTLNASASTVAKSKSSGVLLLPRQFQLPDSGARSNKKSSEADDIYKGKGKGTEVEKSVIELVPGPISSDDKGQSSVSNIAAKNSSNSTDSLRQSTTTKDENNNDTSGSKAKPVHPLRKAVLSGTFPKLEGVVPQINVLIVEDNVINQKILEAFMRKKKIRSAVARDGKEAVEKWRQGGFHLILMDIQLPVMSGLEATKLIRRLEHDNGIGAFSTADRNTRADIKSEDVLDRKQFKSPVIIVALTASSTSADKSEALAAGCNDFLTKPVNLIWLEQKTIEWGCMQALIDYEGWKYWVGREDRSSKINRRTRSRSKSQAKKSRNGGELGSLTSTTNSGKRLQHFTTNNTSDSTKTAKPKSTTPNSTSSSELKNSSLPLSTPGKHVESISSHSGFSSKEGH